MDCGFTVVARNSRMSASRQWGGHSEGSLKDDSSKRTSLKRRSRQMSNPRSIMRAPSHEQESPLMGKRLSISGRQGRLESDLSGKSTIRSFNPLFDSDGNIVLDEDDEDEEALLNRSGSRRASEMGKRIVGTLKTAATRTSRLASMGSHSSNGSHSDVRRVLKSGRLRAAQPIGFPVVLRHLGPDTQERVVYIVKGTTGMSNLRISSSSVMESAVSRFFFENGKEMHSIDELNDCEPNTVLFVSDGEDFYNVGNSTMREVLQNSSGLDPDYHFTIAVLGASEVGKTSIVVQYVNHVFLDTYNHTIEDTYEKDVVVGDKSYRLTIVDTAGQDEFADMRQDWMVKADGYFFVYSMTSQDSMDKLSQFYQVHQQVVAEHPERARVPFLLVANNKDLVDSDPSMLDVSRERSRQIANDMGVEVVEVSALTGENVNNVFEKLIQSVHKVKSEEGKLVMLPKKTPAQVPSNSQTTKVVGASENGCSCTIM